MRPALDAEEFSARMVLHGVRQPVAEFFWKEFQVYYFKPLTPYPTDRIYGDLKIDPEDISYLAADYEKKFRVKLGRDAVEAPEDPSLAELAMSLQRASFRTANA